MKTLLFLLVLFSSSQSAFARKATIYSIDDYFYPRSEVQVSEEGLPSDLYQQLLNLTDDFKFTTVSEDRIESIFNTLKKDRQARMKYPGGYCSTRRAYIQNYLKKLKIVSGKLFISCPALNGRLRLKDQSTFHNYTFSNFHDTNIVSVLGGFQVLDVQFEKEPVSLREYLTEIENSQRIRPLRRKGTSRGLCYWSISTPTMRFKNAD